ncbi:hypothetical protein QTO34_017419 [Cnephaeus nilssonii]|uniref:DDE-1 domain-containing protein n=1 Tax=Cnephaeus nilssonii TaxID=3371016 RepID=A0AA40I0Z3_CNENI|nr:hypothetical protein QTO34_017419 [Eptesicus nilssonii]
MEKVVVWIEDQASHSRLLSKALTFFNTMRLREVEAAGGKFADRSWFMRFKEIQGAAASADVETAASYPEDPAEIINKGIYTKQRIFNIYAKVYSACALSWNNQVWMTVYLFTTWLIKYFKPTIESYCTEKKIPFKILLFIDNAPGHPRALRRCTRRLMLYSWNHNIHSLIVSDSSDGSGQRKLKTFWKGLTILYAIKNIAIYGKSQNININRSSEEVDSSTRDDFEGFRTSVEEVTAGMVGKEREPEN